MQDCSAVACRLHIEFSIVEEKKDFAGFTLLKKNIYITLELDLFCLHQTFCSGALLVFSKCCLSKKSFTVILLHEFKG